MWRALSRSIWQVSAGKAVAVSAFLHAGAIGALAGWTLADPDQVARFSGQQHVVNAEWVAESSPEIPPPPRFEVTPLAAPVIITPQRAQIEQRRLTDTLAAPVPDLSKLPPVEPSDTPIPAPLAATRAEPADGPPEHAVSRSELTPLERTLTEPRPPIAASAESVVPVASLGTDATIPPSFADNQPPRYPDQARRNGWEGTVLLELAIDETGAVLAVRVLESSGYPVLDAAAVTAIRKWKGQPARRGGRAVGTQERLPVRFRL